MSAQEYSRRICLAVVEFVRRLVEVLLFERRLFGLAGIQRRFRSAPHSMLLIFVRLAGWVSPVFWHRTVADFALELLTVWMLLLKARSWTNWGHLANPVKCLKYCDQD
jgi:hypothetical protein